ncbi:zinc-binding dehydrogenase [Bifidobacterium sp.]
MAKVTFGESVCVIGIGPVGLMCVRGAVLRGASRVIGVGSRPICVEVAREYGATDIVSYKDGPIAEQVLDMTDGDGVDRVLIAGGDVDTFAEAIRMLKPGGAIGNVNYLGSGDSVRIPRLEWGVGMGHKTIHGGLMPGGRLRMERLASLIVHGRVDPSLMITHRFEGFDHVEEAVRLMKDKPQDLIKPVVFIG